MYCGEMEVFHVKAHQDKNKRYEELLYESRRNVDCDRAANGAVEGVQGRECVSSLAQETKAMLWSEEGGVTEDPCAWRMGRLAEEVLPGRLKIHRNQFEMVDRSLHGSVLAKVGRRYRPSVIKPSWRENPYMEKLRRDRRCENGLCPRCGNKDNSEHFAKCPRMKSQKGYERTMGNFKRQGYKEGTRHQYCRRG